MSITLTMKQCLQYGMMFRISAFLVVINLILIRINLVHTASSANLWISFHVLNSVVKSAQDAKNMNCE